MSEDKTLEKFAKEQGVKSFNLTEFQTFLKKHPSVAEAFEGFDEWLEEARHGKDKLIAALRVKNDALKKERDILKDFLCGIIQAFKEDAMCGLYDKPHLIFEAEDFLKTLTPPPAVRED